MMTASTTPTIAIVRYWRFKYACAPCCIAAAISCIRALPAGCFRIHEMDHTPKTTAAKPQASASANPDMLFS